MTDDILITKLMMFTLYSLCSSGSSVNRGLSSNICWASDHVVLYIRLGILSRISLNNLMLRFLWTFVSSCNMQQHLCNVSSTNCKIYLFLYKTLFEGFTKFSFTFFTILTPPTMYYTSIRELASSPTIGHVLHIYNTQIWLAYLAEIHIQMR